jgi:SEC-C motif
MVRQRRNERCQCGSGKKAKYCCGSWHGPSPEALDEAFIATALRETHLALIGVRVSGLAAEYLEELVELPASSPGLGVELPRLVDLDLEALLHCCQVGDGQGIDEALPKVARRFHAVAERARLAREVLRLRDEQGLSRYLAALAIFDLSHTEAGVLVEAAVLHAARVRAGVARTASGLLIAS